MAKHLVNYLLLREDACEHLSDVGTYLYRSMKDQGMRVTAFSHGNIVSNQFGYSLKWGLNKGVPFLFKLQPPFNLHRKADEALIEEIRRRKPDVLLVIKGGSLRPSILRRIKERFPKLVLINRAQRAGTHSDLATSPARSTTRLE